MSERRRQQPSHPPHPLRLEQEEMRTRADTADKRSASLLSTFPAWHVPNGQRGAASSPAPGRSSACTVLNE